MKAKWFILCFLLITVAAALAFFLACGDDDPSTSSGQADNDAGDDDNDTVDDDASGPQIQDVNHSACKDGSTGKEGLPGYPESLEFDYDEDVLTVHHVNGVFNCCIERIDVTLDIAGNVIDLYEQEYTPEPCNCICPYDVDTEISGLADGTYAVNIYVNGWISISGETTIPD